MRHDCEFLADLALDGDVSFADADRRQHAVDAGFEEFGHLEAMEDGPDAVVFAASTADVSAVLSAAHGAGVPVTPYAAGTGLEAGAIPVEGGVSLDLTGLDEVHEVRPDSLQVDVGAGVIGADVNEAVARHGLFFPPLPSSGDISTIGGMIATDAAGMGTVKYGEVGDWVLELEAVLPDGSVVELGSKARKTSSGYNLKDVVVGSEGTLAVVTQATLRLAGRPRQVSGGRAVFPTIEDATAAVADAVGSGVDLAKVELLDRETVRMANAYSDVGLPERPTLFVEFHAEEGVESEVEFCRDVFAAHDVERFEVTDDEAEMERLWQARKDLTYALDVAFPDREQLHPGDVTVPIGRYVDFVRFAKTLSEEHGLPIPCFGHAGDGNVHYSIMALPDDPAEQEAAHEAHERLVRKAIDLDGTVTGEHGIGVGKRDLLVAEHGERAVEVMRTVKRAFDPDGILNPGKIFPDE